MAQYSLKAWKFWSKRDFLMYTSNIHNLFLFYLFYFLSKKIYLLPHLLQTLYYDILST